MVDLDAAKKSLRTALRGMDPRSPAWWRANARRLAVGAVVVVVLLGIGGAVVGTDDKDDPETVVTQFFDAILDGDVDRALGFVSPDGTGVPAGDEAVFLDPDAVDHSWTLLVAKQRPTPRADGSVIVDVVLGDGKTTKAGILAVDDKYGQWLVVEPFVKVRLEAVALSYLRVNDKTVVRQELYAYDAINRPTRDYLLFPGRYEFFGDLKGTTAATAAGKLLLPAATDGDKPLRVAPPKLKFTAGARASAQDAVEAIVDDCVRFTVAQPSRCPFGVDDPHTDEFGVGYGEFDDVSWKLGKYPRVRLKDPGDDGDETVGMRVRMDEPGSVALTAAAMTLTANPKPATLRAECRFSAEPLRAVLGPDGKVQVFPLGQKALTLATTSFDLDTCGSDSAGGGSR